MARSIAWMRAISPFDGVAIVREGIAADMTKTLRADGAHLLAHDLK
jgi:hypothetical protein